MKIKKGDIILIAIGLLIGISAICYINYLPKHEGGYVRIFVDNKEFASLPLNNDDTLTIENGDYKNIISVQNGFASMTYANCPDLVCTKHKPIHYNNETIVCLPHKILLEIYGGTDGSIDAYAFFGAGS